MTPLISVRRRLPARRAVLAAALALGAVACSSGDDATDDEPSPSASASASTGVTVDGTCALVGAGTLTALFPEATPQEPTTDDESVCNWDVAITGFGKTGRLYLGPSSLSYDKTYEDNTALGAVLTQLDGIGDRAYLASTPGRAIVIAEVGDIVASASADYTDDDATRPSDGEIVAQLQDLLARYLVRD